MNIEKFRDDYNLITSLSTTWNDRCMNKDTNLTLDNCIDLYSLVDLFNNFYKDFKIELDKFKKNDFCTKLCFYDYYSTDEIKNLRLELYKPFFVDKEFVFVSLIKTKNEIIRKFEEYDYSKDIIIEDEFINNYINLLDKYKILVEAYEFFRNNMIYGDGCTTLFSSITGEFLDDLEEFKLTFGNSFFNTEYFIEANFILGDKLILENKGKFIIDSCEIKDKACLLEKLIHEVYINRSKLSSMYNKSFEKKLVKETF